MPAAAVLQQLQQQNVVLPGGQATLSGINASIQVSGEIDTLDALRGFVIGVPNDGGRGDAPQSQFRFRPVAERFAQELPHVLPVTDVNRLVQKLQGGSVIARGQMQPTIAAHKVTGGKHSYR